ncbi:MULTISPECIES: DNA cytosine methyltransferase [Nocardiaceae]|jgi:DNA (cytosine-5)-methyltransferase 1|uniref:DNA cytosine methyltransferase n=1 Tax=Nocardiaceae TaxID=85025 RepID=UPI0004823FCA|nr:MULTISPECIES: DNA cytosine methyltransferase [Rhodococcus]MDR6909989.1 DNA (cytosine-5)-methyltransferase 1 [Rhodococcus sp. 3258]MDR6931365.1 DNA (cytosine-5)-methyltransferase 1 [Rhodococcus fascians]NIL86325.1 Modification methylase HhaI [Rhodococcus fascians]NIL92319.1 Modification methylase HhaI [Rhodococcus fascians]GHP18116.1 DNA (cytosine-5-)-methyltransferase [Rhodococcus sp. NKCM2511]
MPKLTVVPGGSSVSARDRIPTVAEFFAGIGLVRMGLEQAGFEVCWANDIERDKHHMYRQHFGDDAAHFQLGDVAGTRGGDLPDGLSLAWASFPCTDLSLAGGRAGLAGKNSSTFRHFTRVLDEMGDGRPEVVALENVVGLATSHGGDDLAAAVRELNELGYSVDVLTIDARRFVPQSRPRLFLIGAQHPPEDARDPNSELRPDWLQAVYGDSTLSTHRAPLPSPPIPLTSGLGDLVERMDYRDERWWDADRTEAFVRSLSPIQLQRIEILKKARKVSYRTAYRRTRNGVAVWEARPDDISGCLRTARGGSSKQAVVKIGHGRLQVRWMTPLEYARLMGAGDYTLGGLRNNQALFGFGDAVCVPVVAWLAEHYLMPLVNGTLGSIAPNATAAHVQSR